MEKKFVLRTLGAFSVLTLIGFLIYPPLGFGTLLLGLMTLGYQMNEVVQDSHGIRPHQYVHQQEFEYTK